LAGLFRDASVVEQMNGKSANEAKNVLATALANGPAAGLALEAIRPLFEPGDVVELRALNPDRHGAKTHCGVLHDDRDCAGLESFIRQYNGYRNLYFGVNPRRSELRSSSSAAKAEDVTLRRVMFLDMDNKDAPNNDPSWTCTQAELTALNPSLLVRTGNGFHVYYQIEVQNGEALTASVPRLKNIMSLLGSDNVADLPRIARLPYTVNLPTASKLKRGAVPKLALPAILNTRTSAARPLEGLCTELEEIAVRLTLPGKGDGGNGARPAVSGRSPAGQKTGRPAPSLNVLRLALEELPNNPDGPFADRDKWLVAAHAIKGAARAGGFEREGRDLFLEWSGRYGGDPTLDEKAWDTITTPCTGFGTVMRLLQQCNPDGARRVQTACAQAAFAGAPFTPQDGHQIAALIAAMPSAANRNVPATQRTLLNLFPATLSKPSQIPPRKWLYGTILIRGFPTMMVAPGGTGKSGLVMAMAVAMAVGQELFAGEAPHGKLKVWVHSAEDPLEEQQRRLAAACAHHGVTDADLGRRLILSSARDNSLRLAQMGAKGPEIVQADVDAIVREMKTQNVDVLIVDPIAGMAAVPENDNAAVNIVMDALRGIAERANAAVLFLHHTSKQASLNMDASGVTAARGADAFQAAARVVVQLVRMTSDEARRMGLSEEERRGYFRMENGKANMAPIQNAKWRRLKSVNLNNGTAEYPDGDTVAVIADWSPPAPVVGTASQLYRVQAAISAAAPKRFRASNQSQDWVGWSIAETLGMDAGRTLTKDTRTPDQTRAFIAVSEMVRGWLSDGGLKQVYEKDPKTGREVPYIDIGDPALLRDSTDAKHAA
jgi:hypothetical protein